MRKKIFEWPKIGVAIIRFLGSKLVNAKQVCTARTHQPGERVGMFRPKFQPNFWRQEVGPKKEESNVAFADFDEWSNHASLARTPRVCFWGK